MDKLLDKKIERLILQADTPKLIKKLQTTIKGLNRRRKFVDYWESSEFAAELGYLKSDVLSLYPKHANSCLELIELFMSTTNTSLERCDDSNGYVGDVYRNLSEDWLEVASGCYEKQKVESDPKEKEKLSQFWIKKVQEVIDDNEYSTKDYILSNIKKLLSEQEARLLIEDYENQYDEVDSMITSVEQQSAKLGDKDVTLYTNLEELTLKRFSLGYMLKDLAESLGNMDLYERLFTKIYKENLKHSHIAKDFIEVLIAHEAYDKALHNIKKYWPNDSEEQQLQQLDWLSKIYKGQADNEAQKSVLEEAFALEPSANRLKSLLAISTASEQKQWRKKALELAQQQEDVQKAVGLLLELNEIDLANDMAVTRHKEFEKYHYNSLIDFIDILPENSKLIKVIVYRTLLLDILNNSRKTAYGVAARYFKKLGQLDASIHQLGLSYKGIQDHSEFVATLLDNHGKKSSFWGRIED